MRAPRARAVVRGVCLALLLGTACASAEERSAQQQAAAANLALGVAYLRQGNLAVAQEKLAKALKQNPRDADVHTALAVLHERLGNRSQVDSHYRSALRLAPKSPEIQNNYAVYLCRTGRAQEGVRRFQQAAANPLYRTPEAAYTNAGVCLRTAKRPEEAQRSLERALAVRPSYAEATYQLGDLHLERGRADEALRLLESFLGRFEATPDLLLLGVRGARQACDRLAFERYARRLRVDFASSDQARAAATLGPPECAPR